MSFDYDPYRHIEVLHNPHGNYRIYCHSCGGEFGDYTSAVRIDVLFGKMAEHVQKSHRRERSDFEGWSEL